MSSVEIWTYICYGFAAVFLIAALAFSAMIYINSQNNKKNPIALPKAQKEEVVKKEIFEDEEEASLRGSLPSGRRRKSAAPPVMHKPRGINVSSSEDFFADETDSFKLTGGQDK